MSDEEEQDEVRHGVSYDVDGEVIKMIHDEVPAVRWTCAGHRGRRARPGDMSRSDLFHIRLHFARALKTFLTFLLQGAHHHFIHARVQRRAL